MKVYEGYNGVIHKEKFVLPEFTQQLHTQHTIEGGGGVGRGEGKGKWRREGVGRGKGR